MVEPVPSGCEGAIGWCIASANNLAQKVVDTVGHRILKYRHVVGNRADRKKLPIEKDLRLGIAPLPIIEGQDCGAKRLD